MAGQVNASTSAKAVVCKTERYAEQMVGEISKFSAKLSFNEDGTPTILDGNYLFLKDNGTSLTLNSHLIDVKIDNQVVRVVADDNSVEEITLDCTNSMLMLDEVLCSSDELVQHEVEETEIGASVVAAGDGEELPIENWGDAPTRLLISLYADFMIQVKTRKIRTFKVMWEKLSEVMMEHGYKFSASQVSNRFKTLKRAYNKRKFDLQHKRIQKGRIRPFIRRCPYQRELEELFAKQAEFFPESLPREEETMTRAQLLASVGFDPTVFLEDDDQMPAYAEADSNSPYATPAVETVDHTDYGVPSSSPRRRARPNALDELRSLRAGTLRRLTDMDEKRDAFHEEVLEELKHKNDMLEKLLELVTKEAMS